MSIKKTIDLLFYILIFINIFFISANIVFRLAVKGETVAIPEIKGKTFEEAKKELSKKKLTLVKKGIRHHESFERGKIIFQEPSPGTRLKINSTIKAILSSGKERVVVPSFIGRSLQAVDKKLENSGLNKGNISHVHTPMYAAGKIIAQYPAPSEVVGRNSRVSFLVSQGEREKTYLMPDLLGKYASEVVRKLKKMEFNIGGIRYSFYPGLESGIIINQYPLPGIRIQKRNLITLEVSK